MINRFSGPHRFLSNFYERDVGFDGVWYPTVEHAYQAAKTLDLLARDCIRKQPQPGLAKRLGRTVPIRPDWLEVRVSIMRGLLQHKFAAGSELAQLLIETGSEELVEGNTWGDTFWGVCDGVGKNQLGVLLMERRAQLQEQKGA